MIARLRRDDGFTLVEMIVYFLLAAVVLGVIGGIYITTIGVQRTVSSMTQTTTDSQLAATAIDDAVRNGSEFEITTLTGGDQVLRTRSLDGSDEGVWSCKIYYFSASESTIRSSSGADATRIASPTAEELSGWTLLAENVTRYDSDPVFAVDASFDTVLNVEFETASDDGADSSHIKFSTPLMQAEPQEQTCL